MDASSPFERNLSWIRRLGLPIFCGLFGIFITIALGNIPHSYSSFFLSGFLILFIMTHILWLHKAIQSLRQDLKKSIAPTRRASPSRVSVGLAEEDHAHEILMEATFFQLLRDRLNVAHPPHIQAQCLQDNKIHLIQTPSLIPLLRENQLEILAQPIVNLPQKRLTFFSCMPCATMENGRLINLNTLTGAVNNLPSRQAIDRIILFQNLQFVRRHRLTHPNHGFVCFLPPTIYKDSQCLEEVSDFLRKSRFPFQGLIFEAPLDITEAAFSALAPLSRYGARLMGAWHGKALPKNLSDLPLPPVDFIRVPYGALWAWVKSQPRRHGLESLQQILEISPQVIVSDVKQEQDLYHNLPLPFDYACGAAFGAAKPFYHIQA